MPGLGRDSAGETKFAAHGKDIFLDPNVQKVLHHESDMNINLDLEVVHHSACHLN